MKRYEKMNAHFGENETAEEQSLCMILSCLEDEHGIDIDMESLKIKHTEQIKWLNEEVE